MKIYFDYKKDMSVLRKFPGKLKELSYNFFLINNGGKPFLGIINLLLYLLNVLFASKIQWLTNKKLMTFGDGFV